MRLSANNILETKITAVKEGLVNAEIEMQMLGGQKLTSIITLTSARRLDLQVDKIAFAIFKASNVLIAESCGEISARNVIPCKVSVVNRGKVNTEISLDAGGQTITSIITLESSKNLGIDLDGNKSVYAIIKASDIIVGVPDE